MIFSVSLSLFYIPVLLISLVGSVKLANRFLGPTPVAPTDTAPTDTAPADTAPAFDAPTTDPSDPENPYSAPGHMSVAVELTGKAISEPGFGRSLITVFVQSMAINLTVFGTVSLVEAPGANLLAFVALAALVALPALPALPALNTVVLRFLLPTTFPRALLVFVMQLLLSVSIFSTVLLTCNFLLD